MAQEESAAGPGHPAPQRERVGIGRLSFGVIGAPVAWGVQLVASYGLSSFACFPARVPRSEVLPGWEWLIPGLIGISAAAVLVGLAATLVSWQSWRATRDESAGYVWSLLEIGEGRTRFMAGWGLLFSLGFLLAIIFNVVALFVVPPCTA